MDPMARSMFGDPMLETEVFRKQVYYIEKSICVVVETFPDPPQSFGVPRKDLAPHSGLAPVQFCSPFPP